MRFIHAASLTLIAILSGCDCRNSIPKTSESSDPVATIELVETSTSSPADVFAAIDELASLMQQRLALMPEVARFKWNHERPITDPEREQALLSSLVAKAAKHGVANKLAEQFFAAQISAASSIQKDLFRQWKETDVNQFEQVRDLEDDLRPQISALSESVLKPLATIEPLLNNAATTEYLANALKQRTDATPEFSEALRIAFAPLLSKTPSIPGQ